MPTKQPTRLGVCRLRKARIRLSTLERFFRCTISRRVRSEAIGAKFAVEVDLDGADVGRADWGEAEESPAPSSEEHDALVQGEEAGEGALEVWRDAVELAGKVAPFFYNPGCRGVETMVVAWGKVDYYIVKCCTRFRG